MSQSVHYADSLTLVVASTASETSSNFTRRYDPPIILDPDAHYEIALVRSLLWYTWFNISSAQSNNTLQISDATDTNYQTLTFDDGTYSLSDIQTEIDNFLDEQGFAAGAVVLEPQHSTGKIRAELAANYYLKMNSDLYTILGFTVGQEIIVDTTAPNEANMTNSIDGLLLHCDLIDNSTSYVDEARSQVMYSVSPPTVAPGSLFNAVDTPNLIYLEMNKNKISQIRFWVTSQDGTTPVEFGSGTGDILTHYLHIRKQKIS